MAMPPDTIAFGPFRLVRSRRMLERDGKAVALSARAYDMLHALIEARHRVVGREEIVAHVWPGMTIEPSNVTVQMSALRRALGDAGPQPLWIATVPGRGYQFVGRLAGDEPEPVPPAPAGPSVPGPALLSRWRLGAIVLACLALAAMATAAIVAEMSPPARPRLSIVVMPFRNLSGDASQDFLADAVSDDLTTDLSRIPGSLVIARQSADSYRGRAVTASKVGQALRVRYLLEGSLRKEGATVHINAQLIDTATDAHLWAARFDTAPGSMADARRAIVRRIASAMDVVLPDTEMARQPPGNAGAQDLFLRARSISRRQDTLAGLTQAQALLEQAIAVAPDHTDALAMLGWVLLRKYQAFDDPTAERDLARAEAVIAHALALDPAAALANAARGRLLMARDRYAEAGAAFETALAADPNSTEALGGRAICAWLSGQVEQAVPAVQALLAVDPEGPLLKRRQQLLGLAYLFGGHPREAVSALLASDTAEPDRPGDVESMTPGEAGRLYLIAAVSLAGDTAAARTRYRDYAQVWPNRSVWRVLSFLTRAEAALPAAARIEDALVQAGMPRFSAERGCVAPAGVPVKAGDFQPSPADLPGGAVLDTDHVAQALRGVPAPLVIDVGIGRAALAGSVKVSPEDLLVDGPVLAATPVGQRLAHAGASGPAILMGDGACGTAPYQVARHLVQLGYRHIAWYRGGEEAWARAGQPSEDRRD